MTKFYFITFFLGCLEAAFEVKTTENSVEDKSTKGAGGGKIKTPVAKEIKNKNM
jgi:hypothetical protein